MSQDVVYWNRQTYSSLDWIGDVGGLYDGLRYLFGMIIAPYSSFALQSKLLVSFFKFKPSHVADPDGDGNTHFAPFTHLHQVIEKDFSDRQHILSRGFWATYFFMCFSKKHRRHKRLLKASVSKLSREMDIKR